MQMRTHSQRKDTRTTFALPCDPVGLQQQFAVGERLGRPFHVMRYFLDCLYCFVKPIDRINWNMYPKHSSRENFNRRLWQPLGKTFEIECNRIREFWCLVKWLESGLVMCFWMASWMEFESNDVLLAVAWPFAFKAQLVIVKAREKNGFFAAKAMDARNILVSF